MDSNTQGIENPGFEASSPAQGILEAKVRHPLSYVAQRQPSESGRHLLSEPGTPYLLQAPETSSSHPWTLFLTLQTLRSSRPAGGQWAVVAGFGAGAFEPGLAL